MTFKIFTIVFALMSVYICYLRICNLNLESDLKVSENKNVILSEEVSSLNNQITKMKTANNELSKLVSDFRISNQTLTDKLFKFEKGVDRIAEKHPKMLAKIINEAQEKSNRCFEKITNDEDYKECE